MVCGERVKGAFFGLQADAPGKDLREEGFFCLRCQLLPAGRKDDAVDGSHEPRRYTERPQKHQDRVMLDKS
jgi:hypothetical protein